VTSQPSFAGGSPRSHMHARSAPNDSNRLQQQQKNTRNEHAMRAGPNWSTGCNRENTVTVTVTAHTHTTQASKLTNTGTPHNKLQIFRKERRHTHTCTPPGPQPPAAGPSTPPPRAAQPRGCPVVVPRPGTPTAPSTTPLPTRTHCRPHHQ
jgi:hypothetical protein